MQALIDEDLEALVKAWTHSKQFPGRETFAFSVSILVIAAVWGSTFLGESGGWLFTLAQSLPPADTKSITNVHVSVSFVAWIAWCMLSAIFVAAMMWNRDRVDRVLLIVDDLDRCPQNEIVDLIDGIKLMIDDDKVGQFVQALVLADDRVLQAAIRERFRAFGDSGVDTEWKSAVREHMEKVFLCHVALPRLDEIGVGTLVDSANEEFGGQASVAIAAKLPGRLWAAFKIRPTAEIRSPLNTSAEFKRPLLRLYSLPICSMTTKRLRSCSSWLGNT